MTLAEALAERVNALARTNERLQALDDLTGDHVVQKADADAVLARALAVLADGPAYAAAQRLLGGEDGGEHDELATAGLVVWDPAANALRPTALLVELMKVVER